MAEQRILRSSLRLVLDNGLHPTSGKMVFKTKSFNNVKTDANADQLYAVAQALAELQTLPLYGVERVDNSEIAEV